VKIVVCVKQVGRLDEEVEFTDDLTAVDPDFLEPALNEWDAYAVEAALRLREEHGGEVIAVTAGDEDADDVLRRCLAMGADRAARVDALPGLDALLPARALAPFVSGERPDLVLCGAQSSDAANAATPAALAGLLGLPCVAVARALDLEARIAVVERELEGGLVEVVEVDLPTVVSIQTGANTPRYAALRAIRQAQEQEIAVHRAEETVPASRVVRLRLPTHASSTVLIEGDAAAVADRILALVRERV
jgi:electron transfer flavoprotein beta subunit